MKDFSRQKEEGKDMENTSFIKGTHAPDGNEPPVFFNEYSRDFIMERMMRRQLIADALMISGLILGLGAIICIGIIWG